MCVGTYADMCLGMYVDIPVDIRMESSMESVDRSDNGSLASIEYVHTCA